MTPPMLIDSSISRSSSHIALSGDHPPAWQPSDPSRLAPEHAFYTSPPRRRWERSAESLHGSVEEGERASSRSVAGARRRKDKPSRSRGAKGVWKKLLWVKQSYPDNYTDPPTFLSHLQRNPRLQPYDFWPLVADSTVIVQHVCSVAIFLCCFVGIYHEQLSPISVVSWGSAGTVLGWVCFDAWTSDKRQRQVQQQQQQQGRVQQDNNIGHISHHSSHWTHDSSSGGGGQHSPHATAESNSVHSQTDDGASVASTLNSSAPPLQASGLGLTLGSSSTPSAVPTRPHSRQMSSTSLQALSPLGSPTTALHSPGTGNHSMTTTTYNGGYFSAHPPLPTPLNPPPPPYDAPAPLLSARNQQRLSTAKSAALIYVALLGLSPILKSLTESTTSDSIWAMSTWLMCINVFFFDYGGEVGAKFPASLSTNAALMASTVLASRLTSTTHVFSLTLFSIEVFGLFPVFRRHLRVRSWLLHVVLTVLLIVGAGAAMGITLMGGNLWKAGILGAVVWGLAIGFAMGGCSWWLIGLQRYKNVVIGPWDPARPVIRAGGWD